MSTVGLANHL